MTYLEWKKAAEGEGDFTKKAVVKVSDFVRMDVGETIHKSVGAKAKNYDVFSPVTGEITHLAEREEKGFGYVTDEYGDVHKAELYRY